MSVDNKTIVITVLITLVLILIIALVIMGTSSRSNMRGVYLAQVTRPIMTQPQQVYLALPGQDHLGDDILYRPDLAGNIQGLQQLCNDTPECVGFNSGGYLKNNVSPVLPSSYDFYYRQ